MAKRFNIKTTATSRALNDKRKYIDYTRPDLIEPTAGVIQLYYGCSKSIREVAKLTGFSVGNVRRMLDKYRTPVGTKDITINIMSKV